MHLEQRLKKCLHTTRCTLVRRARTNLYQQAPRLGILSASFGAHPAVTMSPEDGGYLQACATIEHQQIWGHVKNLLAIAHNNGHTPLWETAVSMPVAPGNSLCAPVKRPSEIALV